jgi:hypothetical protein
MAELTSHSKLNAQSFLKIGPSVSAGTKTFPLNGRFGLGFSLEYERSLHRHGNLTVSTGYTWFNQRFPGIRDSRTFQDSVLRLGVNGSDMSFIPIRIGYQRFFYKKAAFALGQVGFSKIISDYRRTHSFPGFAFNLAFGTGYRFTFPNKRNLELSLTYNYNRLNNRQSGWYRLQPSRNYFNLSVLYTLIVIQGKKLLTQQ